MEEEMEECEVYEVVEVDFDYEFDASRFFDFTRPETELEARLSESWFDSAIDYPPSPFVAKLFPTEDLYSHNMHVSPKAKYDNNLSLVDGEIGIGQEMECFDQDEAYGDANGRTQTLVQKLRSSRLPSTQNHAQGLFKGSARGLTFYNHLADDMKKTNTKSFAKPSLPRSSTLMKPTASQLAKQNQRRQVCDSRSQKNEGSSSTQCATEGQASKRQKLDGGLLRKIVDVKQPINLIHKLPKKDCAAQGMIAHTKLRLTISREPEFETTHRAERIRSTGVHKAENPAATTNRFKARPLNRKILEAPVLPVPKRSTPRLPEFQAFNLKTTERAKHHGPSATSTLLCQTNKGLNKTIHKRVVETGNADDKRCDSVGASNLAACQPVHTFKARPLDRKILASRGDIGVFRNSKREVTVPKAFEFQTAKRNHQNPPIELFSKLSLVGEPQSKSCAPLELSKKTSIASKPLKENRGQEPTRQNHHMKHQEKEKPDAHCRKQNQSVAKEKIGEIGRQVSMRPLGNVRQL